MSTRVAILLANNDKSPFSLKFPDDGVKVARRFAVIRPEWDCRIWSVKDNHFPTLSDADAFVITGSPASVSDGWPWIERLSSLIQKVDGSAKALIGLCFGHQLIATALGGKVERSGTGWRIGAVETHFISQPEWMRPACSRLRLFAAHSEQVTQLPTGAKLLGAAMNCPHASFSLGSHILTTQYHPEFTAEFMNALLTEYLGELPEEALATGRQDLELPVHGDVFFEWIAHFIELSQQADNS